MLKSSLTIGTCLLALASQVNAELTTAQQIQQMYIGYLGRAADAAGLAYWTEQVDLGNITVDQIRANIVNEQPEYLENYGQLTFSELAVKVYENLLNRQPDQAGLEYWVGQLESGAVPPESLIIAYIHGAQDNDDAEDDRDLLANKLTVAECYTNNPNIYSDDLVAQIIAEMDSSDAYSQCPPVAEAGSNQTAGAQEAVQLSGSGADVEGGLTYLWEQISGSSIALSSYTISNPTFTANDDGTYTFQLTVTDGSGATSTDTVSVTIGSGSNGIEVSVEDFDLLLQSGVWRTKYNFTFSSSQAFDGLPTGDVTINYSVAANGVTVNAIQFNNVNDVVYTDCYDGPQQLTSDDFEESLLIEQDEDSDQLCEFSYKYYKINDASYRIELYCDATLYGEVETIKVSDSSTFDFGNLAFSSTLYPSLSTSTGVCGERDQLTSSSTFTPPSDLLPSVEIDQSSIGFGAPYQDNWIYFEFDFPGEITTGTFNVNSFAQAAGEVEADAVSAVFGGTAEDPQWVSGISGTVTVSSVGEYSASGSFNFITGTGDTLQGTFDFDMQ